MRLEFKTRLAVTPIGGCLESGSISPKEERHAGGPVLFKVNFLVV